jgi:hypothetical protein
MNEKRGALARQASSAGAGAIVRLSGVAAQLELSALGSVHLPLAALAGFLEGAAGVPTPPAELDAHPLVLHRELLSLVGALGAFAPDDARVARWERLPPFAFDDLGGTFAPLFQLANGLVGALGARGHLAIKLAVSEDRRQFSVFKGRLPEDPGWRQKRPAFLWVKVPSGDPLALSRSGLIKAFAPSRGAAWEGRGDSVSPATDLPDGLPVAEAGSAYLAINPSCWSEIAASSDVVVYAPSGASVELRAPSP